MKHMLRIIMIGLMIGVFFLSGALSPSAENQPLPSYVKWGKIAMTKAKEKYPNSEITDYLHVGKEDKKTTATEKFKLIVNNHKKEIGVHVHLTYDKRTERLLSVEMKEGKP